MPQSLSLHWQDYYPVQPAFLVLHKWLKDLMSMTIREELLQNPFVAKRPVYTAIPDIFELNAENFQ